MKYIYPAVFSPGEPDEGGFTVTFPDLPGCITEGDDLEEALRMAKDALGGHLYLMEEDGDEIPRSSQPDSIQLETGEFVSLIQANTDFIRERIQSKAVNKTVTLPKWLNDVAAEEGINFSQTLQDALKQKLEIKDFS
ncbi:type II toxin-antitoxin system HicB family antitoxin [Paenibacillus larvae]|uniref:HicB-like protein n=1 Tax=Bacteriophage Lily TaxID=1589751 RepID=A0A0C5AEN7_9CAUD|nr:type II toxin-antitoxin system HicB family antitoxin [Paenibacillus larvae]YP_009202279.1 toxin-antitoxin system HicB-like [Bacteriophage Lily]AJK27797.1 HicB-like protein [Bacteriophage Lily]MCY9564600.1 type II toxin-antitoxin system HicB family antitoxin [Paenibacillus larvae]MCY9568330.1 type II toxin-antitoxin system HicB family antitoxin [Paenibacillus larvae]MCY9571670.1 type II toxin-antitoxin system HicB family antitoxin [Paenibacillus larvae]MCY9689345.1 type II toxin-antitoxin s